LRARPPPLRQWNTAHPTATRTGGRVLPGPTSIRNSTLIGTSSNATTTPTRTAANARSMAA
jgi:hypothetical protein